MHFVADTPTPSDNKELVAELRPDLVAFFDRRCSSTAEAEDLAQDVLLRALSHAQWTSAEHARSYVFRIALNCWRDRGRRRQTRGIEVDWDEERVRVVTDEISLERALSSEEEFQEIVGALYELEERTRDVLILCRLEQMKQAEIAAVLGISISTVEKHLVKAVTHLARARRMHQDAKR